MTIDQLLYEKRREYFRAYYRAHRRKMIENAMKHYRKARETECLRTHICC